MAADGGDSAVRLGRQRAVSIGIGEPVYCFRTQAPVRMSSLVVSLVLLAQSAPELLLAREPYVSERLGVRFHPPAGWELASAGSFAGDLIEFRERGVGHGARLQLVVFPFELSPASSLEKIQHELSSVLLGRFPGLRVIEERTLTHHGHPGIELTATLPIENTYYHVVQRCIYARRRIYVMTGAAFEANFLENLPRFRAAMASLAVPEPRRGLVEARGLLFGALGILAAGFVLRRVSIHRLEREGRWPIARAS